MIKDPLVMPQPQLRMLSLLGPTPRPTLDRLLNDLTDWRCLTPPVGSLPSPSDLLAPTFWKTLGAVQADAVIIELNVDQLEQLINDTAATRTRLPAWTNAPFAVIALLNTDQSHHLELAAPLNFDALLAQPYNTDTLNIQLHAALRSFQRRQAAERRQNRLRRLCHTLNGQRQRLQQQVEFVCRDLVTANAQLTTTLNRLQHAYDLQSLLADEFDPRHLLYKALRFIKAQFADASTTLFLHDDDAFAAHIAGPWYEPAAIALLEDAFTETIIPRVADSHQPLLLPDAQTCPNTTAAQRQLFAGLSIMALPLTRPDYPLGVLILYRSAPPAFTPLDQKNALPMLAPLAHAMAARQKLLPLLNMN